MTESAQTYQLKNGLRIIQIDSPTDVAYCGISIDAGTRDELEGEEGIAHFCEHMMFKGTRKRKAWHIINRMEAVGGDLNAYTNKEETVVYAAFMREHFDRAAELIFDIVFGSTYPFREMEKEREVIADEIECYNDLPAELIFDRFEDLIYEGNSLGHDILGTTDNVRRFLPPDLRRFAARLYRPERMVFFVYGNVPFEKVKRVVERAAKGAGCDMEGGNAQEITLAESRPVVPMAFSNAGLHIEERGTHQAHVMIGRAAYGSDDERRTALYLLNNLLGGPGMNSWLNVSLREHKGLVYNVESSLTNYTDTSTWAIYFGCDVRDVNRCLRLVRKELDRLMAEPLNERVFKAAVKQTEGQICVACDNFENYALDMAKAFLHYNRFEGRDDTFAHLRRLTPQLLREVATEIFDEDKLTTLVFR